MSNFATWLAEYSKEYPAALPLLIPTIVVLICVCVNYVYNRIRRSVMSTPISPYAAIQKRIKTFPSYVIEAVNELLVLHSDGNTSIKLKQEDIISKILLKCPEVTRNYIYENKLLDFEQVFNAVGWDVTYHKADYNDTNSTSYYTFKHRPVSQGDPVTGL